MRFPGQYFDGETGWNHNGFRDYFTTLARYIEADPIGLSATLNAYSYADGNPISETDLYGLKPELIILPPGDSTTYQNAANVPSTPGTITVVIHGTPFYVIDENGQELPISTLANMIEDVRDRLHLPKNAPVKLISCNTGFKTQFGMHPVAQQLQDILGEPVQAPNNFVWIYANGDFIVAPSNLPGYSWDNATASSTRAAIASGPNLGNPGSFVTYPSQ